MTQHQSKRQYNGSQPHITSYFSAQSPSYSISHSSDTDNISSRLPSNIQSNLLSVGMRIRKSVPEGYKTGSEYSAFELFSETYKPPHSISQAMEASRPAGAKTRPRANASAGVRELVPFCGLMKVGGMDMQGTSERDQSSWSRLTMGPQDIQDEDDVPFLSQGSTLSNVSFDSNPVSPNGNKRRCEWDDSGEDDEVVLQGEVKTNGGPPLMNRVLAVPRRRKYQGAIGKIGGIGQENRVFGEDMDFGEAEFLDYAALRSGAEVDMTDI